MTTSDNPTFGVRNFWPGHDPASDPIVQRLTRQGFLQTAQSRRADLIVASVYGREGGSYREKILVCSGEPWFHDEFASFTIDGRFQARPNHYRLPLWAYVIMKRDYQYQPVQSERAPHFCNFIFSNPRCPTRNAFFELLNSRQPIDSLGSVMNNKSDTRLSERSVRDWRTSKIDVLRDYRFTIAFENTELPGYTTEKMIDAWLAGSVPIYWGNPAFTIDFPADSCLSLYEAGSLSKLIDQVREAENEPERYAQLQAANPFRTGEAQRVLAKYEASLSEFIEMVVEDIRTRPRTPVAKRRTRVKKKVRFQLRRIRFQLRRILRIS